MNYQIKITENALKQYKKINNPFKNTIRKKIDMLAEHGLSKKYKSLDRRIKRIVSITNWRLSSYFRYGRLCYHNNFNSAS